MTNAIGFDAGTSRIVTARPQGEGFRCDSQLNAFVELPDSPMTAAALSREGVAHARRDGKLQVFGDEAARFADLLDIEPQRPMVRGVLNAAEPAGVDVMRALAERLGGRAPESGGKLCFSVPAPPLEASEAPAFHEATLRQVFADLGWSVSSVDEGMAVVYAELAASNYTGIGVSCGGGLCNVCVSYLSVPVVSFSIPKAGDFVDASAAAATGERANRIRLVKESAYHVNGHFSDQVQQAINVYYDELIRSLSAALKKSLASARSVPRFPKPVPLVLAGGTALPRGFRERFQSTLEQTGFPLPLSEVRMASDPLTATARGACLSAQAA